MKRTACIVALALVSSLFTVGPVRAAKPEPSQGASGTFTLTVHTHSSKFRGPGGAPLLKRTKPLSFDIREGERFSYASVECESPAPFNDVALDFNPDYPGIDDPAAVRHVVEGMVVEDSGDTGEIEGTITTFLCDDGDEGDRILFEFEAEFRRISDNRVLLSGTFDIEGGTGRFQDITGEGEFSGELTCLPSVLQRAGASSRGDLGVFSDFVAELSGSFSDRTT